MTQLQKGNDEPRRPMGFLPPPRRPLCSPHIEGVVLPPQDFTLFAPFSTAPEA